MVVTLRLVGSLQKYFGGKKFEIFLPEGAVLIDLIHNIGEKWSNNLPEFIFDFTKFTLSTNIYIMIDNIDINDRNYALKNGQEVILLLPVSGGIGQFF